MRTALSKSQSAKMMKGLLPPSSKETFFKLLLAQDLMITWPISVLPVKPSLRTSGWSAMAWPHWLPVKLQKFSVTNIQVWWSLIFAATSRNQVIIYRIGYVKNDEESISQRIHNNNFRQFPSNKVDEVKMNVTLRLTITFTFTVYAVNITNFELLPYHKITYKHNTKKQKILVHHSLDWHCFISTTTILRYFAFINVTE